MSATTRSKSAVIAMHDRGGEDFINAQDIEVHASDEEFQDSF